MGACVPCWWIYASPKKPLCNYLTVHTARRRESWLGRHWRHEARELSSQLTLLSAFSNSALTFSLLASDRDCKPFQSLKQSRRTDVKDTRTGWVYHQTVVARAAQFLRLSEQYLSCCRSPKFHSRWGECLCQGASRISKGGVWCKIQSIVHRMTNKVGDRHFR